MIALIPLITALLRIVYHFLKLKPDKKKEMLNELEKFNKAIASGNSSELSAAFAKLHDKSDRLAIGYANPKRNRKSKRRREVNSP